MTRPSSASRSVLTPERRRILEVFASAQRYSRALDRRHGADFRDGLLLGGALLLVVLLMVVLSTFW